MLNLPNFARKETFMMRYIKRFHQKVIYRFGIDSTTNMKSTCWQIEQYLEENGKYHDSGFIRGMQQSLEKIIQQRCGNNWSVKKAKLDFRGRTRGIDVTMPHRPSRTFTAVEGRRLSRLSREIAEKIAQNPRAEVE